MKALVTGANGHIGSHVVQAVRAAGFTPIGFVRPGADERGLNALGLGLELRRGDLLDAASVEAAVAGMDLVFHVGAPHRNFAKDPDEIVRPAVEGTRNVLAAARKHGVKRVVYTSTGATVGFAQDPSKPLDESHFHEHPHSAYIRAKVEAEKLARAAEGIDVVILNPSGVFGPGDWRITPATRALIGLLQGDPAFLHVSVTDVRDVATAHVLAAQRGRAGERYLIVGEVLSPAQLAALLKEVSGVKPAQMRPPAFLMRWLGRRAEKKALREGGDTPFDPRALEDLAGGHLAYDASKSKRELGMTYRPAREVLADAVRWIVQMGALKPSVAKKVRVA